MNYLALDVGMRKMGMAVGSDLIRQARPLPLVPSADQHIPQILLQLKKWQIQTILIGDPGQREENQPLLDYIAILKAELSQKIPASCCLISWTEQGSSQEAKRLQKDLKKYEHATDSLAAMLILQGYFDFSQSF